MISKVVSAAAVAALIIAAAPASAMKMASCNQKSMDKTDAMLMKMPDGENKTNGMQEMTSAKSSMSPRRARTSSHRTHSLPIWCRRSAAVPVRTIAMRICATRR